MHARYIALPIVFSLQALLVSGCGLHTPAMALDEDPNTSAYLAGKIVGHVKCELGRAILDEIKYDKDNAAQNHFERRLEWLDDSAGTLTITMQVKESGVVSPSLNWVDPLSKLSSFNLGVGASVNNEATRKQQTDYVFSTKTDFVDEVDKRRYDPDRRTGSCENGSDVQIEGDLRISEWLHSSLLPFNVPGYVGQHQPDVLTDDITFVASVTGSTTPGGKLYRVAINPSAPFASVSRARTNEALISLGPIKSSKTGRSKSDSPSQTVLDFRNIALIGSALNLSVSPRP